MTRTLLALSLLVLAPLARAADDSAQAKLADAQGKEVGTATFAPADGGTKITVNVTGRLTGKNLGKMTLAEVQQDYQRLLRENMIYGGNLQFSEVVQGGLVLGYTANMPALSYTVWNMTPDSPAGNASLQLTFP